jgi:hypothetical protein
MRLDLDLRNKGIEDLLSLTEPEDTLASRTEFYTLYTFRTVCSKVLQQKVVFQTN